MGVIVGVVAAVALVVLIAMCLPRSRLMDDIVNLPIKPNEKRRKFFYSSYRTSASALKKMNSSFVGLNMKPSSSTSSVASPVPGSVIAAFDASVFSSQTTSRQNPLFDADAINAVFENEAEVDISDHESDVDDSDTGYDFSTFRKTQP